MFSLRQVKSRIKSVESVRKLTRALEVVSISKFRLHKKFLLPVELYAQGLNQVLQGVLSDETAANHPFIQKNSLSQEVILCLVTSDTGLCGTYNHALISAAERFLADYGPEKSYLVTIGQKGFLHFKKKGFRVIRSVVGLNGRYSDTLAYELLDTLAENFLFFQAAGVFLCYARMAGWRFKVGLDKLLGIELPNICPQRYLFEPDKEKILEELIPRYLFFKIKLALLHSFCCEHQARALAMGESNQNADNLLEALLLQRNKIRQQSITREIIEIISAAEALKH